MGRLDGKVAFVTGGAGSIGAASARAMVGEGARVVIADLDEAALRAVAEPLGDSCAWIVCDVTSEEQVAAGVGLAVSQFGGLDVAFANAGIAGENAPIASHSTEAFARVLEVNVVGPFLVLKHAMGAMRDGGSLIVTSSVVGLTAAPGIAGYATSKHAVVGLMRVAAKEGAERGIRCNTIHPGPVANAFQDAVERDATGAPTEQANEIFNSMIPLGRHARAGEIAAAVVYLASDESAFVTGMRFSLDGGMSI
jgi:NAD(P)-dependent dehydrogenase (short-subunit alcohol dehydrogenase family)